MESSTAIDQSFYASKANYSIMLDVQIPLGDSSKQAQIAQIKSKMYGLGKEAFSIQSKMASLHAYSQKNFVQIEETLSSLRNARNAMQLSLYEQRKKFNQGRLDYLFLLQEEDNLTQLDAKMASMEFERKALLIEYFSIFDKTPCPFNLLKNRS